MNKSMENWLIPVKYWCFFELHVIQQKFQCKLISRVGVVNEDLMKINMLMNS